MKRQNIWSWTLILLLLGAGRVEAQKNLPKEKIPASVMTELNQLSLTFQDILVRDCPAELCVAKGCSYEDHEETKAVESRSLPGLAGVSEDARPTDGPQNFLTKARCEFVYESKLNSETYGILRTRLQQKLSRGFLSVSINGTAMNPMPESLQDKGEKLPPSKETPDDWKNQREKQLWNLGLAHGPWMLGILLLTMATLIVIWAFRKLGKKSLEDQLAEAELLAEASKDTSVPVVDENAANRQLLIEILQAQPDRIALIARYWLEEESFDSLAQLLSLTQLGLIMPQDPTLAMSQQKFQQHLLNNVSPFSSWLEFKTETTDLMGRISILMDDNLRLFHSIEKLWRAKDLATVLSETEPVEALYVLSRLSPFFQWNTIRSLDTKAMKLLFQQAAAQPRIAPAALAHTHGLLKNQMGLSSSTVDPVRPRVQGLGFPIETAVFIRLSVDHGSFGNDRESYLQTMRDSDGTIGSIKVRSLGDLLQMTAELRRDLLLMLEPDELAAWLALYSKADQEKVLQDLPGSLANRLRGELMRPASNKSGSGVLANALRKIHSV